MEMILLLVGFVVLFIFRDMINVELFWGILAALTFRMLVISIAHEVESKIDDRFLKKKNNSDEDS